MPAECLPVEQNSRFFPSTPDIHWFAVYTRPRHEKCVVQQCNHRGLQTFLPLYTALRQWKNRRAQVELPLFPAYVFVRISLRDKLKVLTIPSTVSFVSFQGSPAIIPDQQIDSLSRVLAERRAEPHVFLTAGQRVQVVRGPFAGLGGVVIRNNGNVKLVVSIEGIFRSVAVQLNAADLELIVTLRSGQD